MNQVDKELMQEKGILTENEKADEYEIQKAAMKEAVFFLAAMLEKNLDMSELQTISLYLKELSMKQHYMHIHLYVQQLYRNSRPHADSPMDNEQVGEEVYISMINKAEKYCWFMTPYLIITDEMTHALCLAAKRGVDVRIITPGIPDKKFIYNVTRSFYHGLVKHGVRVYEWTPGFCHAKMSVADDCMATCGTINLDYRSLYHHFENGCFMADCQAVVEIKNDLIRTMGECRDVTDQYQTGRSAYLRLGQLFMRLFAGLL